MNFGLRPSPDCGRTTTEVLRRASREPRIQCIFDSSACLPSNLQREKPQDIGPAAQATTATLSEQETPRRRSCHKKAQKAQEYSFRSRTSQEEGLATAVPRAGKPLFLTCSIPADLFYLSFVLFVPFCGSILLCLFVANFAEL